MVGDGDLFTFGFVSVARDTPRQGLETPKLTSQQS